MKVKKKQKNVPPQLWSSSGSLTALHSTLRMCTHNYQSTPSLFKCLFCSLQASVRRKSFHVTQPEAVGQNQASLIELFSFLAQVEPSCVHCLWLHFPHRSKRLLHNRTPGSCSKMHQSMHVLYVHLYEYGKRRGHAFFWAHDSSLRRRC